MKVALLFNSWEHFWPDRLQFANRLVHLGHSVQIWIPSFQIRQAEEGGFRNGPMTLRGYPLSRKSLNPMSALRTLIDLSQLIRSTSPDLIHCFAIKPILLGGIIARSLSVKHRVMHLTGLGSLFLSKRILHRALRYVLVPGFRFAMKSSTKSRSAWIFQNPSDQKTFASYLGAEESQISAVIPGNGLDLSQFPDSSDLSAQPPLILFTGRLLSDKGIREFVDALKILRERKIPFEATVMGGLDLENPSGIRREEVLGWQEEGLIRWVGHQTKTSDYYLSASLFCLPSYGEGFSRVLMEASAYGLPIVTTDTPGCRDVVLPDTTAFVVPARDAKSLAVALEKLIQDRKLSKKMGEQAREYALRTFDRERLIDQTLEIYRRIGAA